MYVHTHFWLPCLQLLLLLKNSHRNQEDITISVRCSEDHKNALESEIGYIHMHQKIIKRAPMYVLIKTQKYVVYLQDLILNQLYTPV
jgi:hypothetical protein